MSKNCDCEIASVMTHSESFKSVTLLPPKQVLMLVALIAVSVTSCSDYRKTVAKGDAQMLVLADICSALKCIEEGKTNNAALILQTRLDGEILRLSSNLAPKSLSETYSKSPDFAQVKAYRTKNKGSEGSATRAVNDDEVLKALGIASKPNGSQ